MNCDELQQLAALKALGALDAADANRLQDRLSEDLSARVELARFLDVIGAWNSLLVRPVTPSASLRGKILDRISSLPQSTPRNVDRPPAPPGFEFFHQDERPWIQTPIPGLKVKNLGANPQENYRIVLVQLAPGCSFPAHHHTGPEDLFLVSGDLVTEGRILAPGDHLHADGATDHHPLHSPHGCVALIVEPIEGPEFRKVPGPEPTVAR